MARNASGAGTNYVAPASIMLLTIMLSVGLLTAIISFMLSQPWIGVKLAADGSNGLLIEDVIADSPANGLLGTGDRLLAIETKADSDNWLIFEDSDIIAEPDGLPRYADIERLYSRQSIVHSALSQPKVRLEVYRSTARPDTKTESDIVTISPVSEPLRILSSSFWVQVASGLIGFVISMLVWALAPRSLSGAIFALSGVALMMAALAASIYSSREIAMDGEIIKWLSWINHSGALGFGSAMTALFLIYPKKLISNKAAVAVVLLAVPLEAMDVMQVIESPVIMHYLPTLAFMAAIAFCIGLQWYLSRHNPIDRASLIWVGLAVILGAGSFVGFVATPQLFGQQAIISQAYGFAFFVAIYIGIALGIRRYKLFDIGTWSFQILFYSFSAVLLIMVDAALIAGLNLAVAPSLGLSVVIIAFLWLPMRDTIWRMIYRKRMIPQHELFGAAMNVAFASTSAERRIRWQEFLKRAYRPLEIHHSDAIVPHAAIIGGGTAMQLPQMANSPALELRHAFGGRALFGTPHLQLANQIVSLLTEAEQMRDAYERGVLEERQRIATDLHDDVGGYLITGLQTSDDRTRPFLHAALTEMRMILNGLVGEAATVGNLLADLRHEMLQRLKAAGIEADWAVAEPELEDVILDRSQYKALLSSVREIVTNSVRHSKAAKFTFSARLAHQRIHISLGDDGIGLDEMTSSGGNGLRNISKRIEDAGGKLHVDNDGKGLRYKIILPLNRDNG